MNNGEFIEHKKTIEPETESKTKFYDLKIIDSIIKTESSFKSEKILDRSQKIEYLRYENGTYIESKDR